MASTDLRKGDVVLVETGDTIPADGDVIEGVASVDESAITGESAPVIREAGGDFSSVTGGTRVLSDWIVVRVAVNPGEAFLDRMIAMVEGAKRKKTPNEIALTILLVALTIVMLLATATLLPFSTFAVEAMKAGHVVTITALVALLVCLIPTTIGGLLSAIGVAGMSRMMQANVIATSGRAVEAAGDVDVLLLDKTGTITLGNRQASAFVPAPFVTEEALADAAQLSSLADETPEGRSIVVLAKQRFNLRERDMQALHPVFLSFSAQTRMSGVDLFPNGTSSGAPGREIRKGAADAIKHYVESHGGHVTREVDAVVTDIARRGSTPLAVAERVDGVARVLGVIELKDIVKGGIKEALRGTAQDGHQDRDGDGRQPADGRGDRGGGGRRRFPRGSDAGNQARDDPRASGGGPSGRDDRRRHQRRAGARAGRRGGRDEHGYAGGEGSRQHGRPRLEPDETDRDRRDR